MLKRWRKRGTVVGRARVLRMIPITSDAKQTQISGVEHRIGLLVDVAPRKPYEVDIVVRVPRAKLLATGNEVPIRIDKADPKRVEIDFDRLPQVDLASHLDDESPPA